MRDSRMVGLAAAMVCASAAAQTFNIDISPAPGASAPSPSYGAAGRAGFWNSLPATQGVSFFNLVDVNGATTEVRLSQIGGTVVLDTPQPGVTGDDALLLQDHQTTYTASLETCIFINGLENGEYEVLIYAWMPGQPGVKGYTSVDEEPGFPHYEVGGAWSGAHEEFVTYSRHTAIVTQGRIGLHSGIAPGANQALGAPLNGLQIRKVEPCPGDIDGDGQVGAPDLAAVLGSWLAPGGPADVNGDGIVNVFDLALLLGSWGPCP